MKLTSKKINLFMTVIWYFSIIFFLIGAIHSLIALNDDLPLLTLTMYLASFLVIAIPFLYCLFQLKKIIFSLSNDTFFSLKTAHRFSNIGYGILFFNCKIISDAIYLCNVPCSCSHGSDTNTITETIYINELKQYPINYLLDIKSPIIILVSTIILSSVFILITKTLKQATLMKDEIDQTV